MAKQSAKRTDPLAFDTPLELDLAGHSAEDLMAPLSQLVAAHPDGVSTPDLAQAVSTTAPTAQKALQLLEKERHIYSRRIGKTTIWYPNGRLVHPYLQLKKEMRGRIYNFTVREGRAGPTIQVLERSFSVLNGERTEGSIFVETATLKEFIAALEELAERFSLHEQKHGA
ncbi:MAG: hypothetical protein QOG31_1916 [Thermoplasmata archaeon]|jgi:hypothetical protein|nr:hypothetical protein [Thermoplasmata archaeon]